MRRTIVPMLCCLALASAACGGGDRTDAADAPTEPEIEADDEEFTSVINATIDGAAWRSTSARAQYGTATLLRVSGWDSTSALSVSFGPFSGPGTYALVQGDATVYGSLLVPGSQGWSTRGAGGTGSVTITKITASHITGTFSFMAVPSNGSTTTGTRTVQVRFHVQF